jgi:hypothetical protein
MKATVIIIPIIFALLLPSLNAAAQTGKDSAIARSSRLPVTLTLGLGIEDPIGGDLFEGTQEFSGFQPGWSASTRIAVDFPSGAEAGINLMYLRSALDQSGLNSAAEVNLTDNSVTATDLENFWFGLTLGYRSRQSEAVGSVLI